ncbi:TetR family transcriptional regulator [Geodermatophilus sp. SYSU D00965]
MRSVERDTDLTARARIRDAAVRLFGREGFGVPVRAVAAEAGVSPGLVIHHFGSKDALRAACDEHVLAEIRRAKTEAVLQPQPGEFLAALAAIEEYAPVAGYLVHALHSGGDLAAAFLAALVRDTEGFLEEGVAAGTVRPSRDPAARARFLVHVGLGALLVHLRSRPAEEDLGASLRSYAEQFTLPALELYTEGLLADRGLLDDYLADRAQRSAGTPRSPEEGP